MDPITAFFLLLLGIFALYIVQRMLLAYELLKCIYRSRSEQIALRIAQLERPERLSQLIRIARPKRRYSRHHARFPKQELGAISSLELLDLFERRLCLAASDSNRMFLGVFNPEAIDVNRTSIVVGMYLGYFSRFIGWITVEDQGPNLEYHLICSEIRFWRTPPEAWSNFEYSENQSSPGMPGSDITGAICLFVYTLWDIVFSNCCSHEAAKQAAYFQRFILEVWAETIEIAMQPGTPKPRSPLSRPSPDNVVSPPQPAKPRPGSRD